MSKQPSSTVYEMLLRASEVYCGQRLLAGVAPLQVKHELFGAYYDMLDRKGPTGASVSSRNGSPAPIDESAFHGLAGEFVRAVGPHTEADRVGLLVQVLGAFGCAAGRNAYVLVESDRHYPNLYVVLFGATARGRKGTSLRRVWALMSLADPEWYERCVIHGGLSSGEGVTWAVRDPNEQAGDPGVSDKRALFSEGEFGGVLKIMGREGNTLSAVLRSGWDQGVLTIKNKNSPGKATGAHIALIGHVTLDEFRERIDGVELAGGTMNRILHVAVTRGPSLPHGGRVPEDELRRLAYEVKLSLEFARQERELRFTPGARRLWELVYPLLTAERVGQYGAATARAEAQTLRLSLIFALLERSPAIEERHLWAALAVWDYCDRSAAHVYGDRMSDRAQDRVLDAIRAHGGWIAKGDLVNALQRHVYGARLDDALASLLVAGLIETREEKTNGRPKDLFRAINARKPTLLELISLSSQLSARNGDSPTADTHAAEERDAIQHEPRTEASGDDGAGRKP